MVYIIAAQRLCVIPVECKLEIATPSARNDKRGKARNDKSGWARNDASLLSLRGALPLKGDVAIYLEGRRVLRLPRRYKFLGILPLSHPNTTPNSLLAS
jgi:hypothetical protein